MPLIKTKRSGLLAALLAALAIAGCGGGSEDSASTVAKPSAADGSAQTETAPVKKQKQGDHSQKQNPKGQTDKPVKKSTRAEAEDLIRKAGRNGVKVNADSPMARKIIESLTEGKGAKRGKKSPNSVAKAVQEVLDPQGGGGGNENAGGGQGEGVSKILEQIGK
jgi:hypothetical protein